MNTAHDEGAALGHRVAVCVVRVRLLSLSECRVGSGLQKLSRKNGPSERIDRIKVSELGNTEVDTMSEQCPASKIRSSEACGPVTRIL